MNDQISFKYFQFQSDPPRHHDIWTDDDVVNTRKLSYTFTRTPTDTLEFILIVDHLNRMLNAFIQ